MGQLAYETISTVGNLLLVLRRLKLISDTTDQGLMGYMYDERLY